MSAENENQENQKETLTSEIVASVIPLLRELLPVLIDRLLQPQGRTSIDDLEEEIEQLKVENRKLDRRLLWTQFFVIIQAIFFTVFLVIYLINRG